jgi:hypothetical protein
MGSEKLKEEQDNAQKMSAILKQMNSPRAKKINQPLGNSSVRREQSFRSGAQ